MSLSVIKPDPHPNDISLLFYAMLCVHSQIIIIIIIIII